MLTLVRRDESDGIVSGWSGHGRVRIALTMVVAAAVSGCAAVGSERSLGDAIDRAAGYLVRQALPDGRFRYRVHLDPQARQAERYNILRHAGTIHSLAQYYARTPSPEVLETMRRAAQFLRECCVGPLADDARLLAVWSLPAINGGSGPRQAKLGGAGLGLVALAGLERITPGFTPLDDLRRLGEFILFMQKADGSFYSKYYPDRLEGSRRSDEWTSLYYPGEAALGLVMLHELDPRPQWLLAAGRALEHLARQATANPDLLPSQWDLLAIERLLPLLERSFGIGADREALLGYARRAAEMTLAAQQPLAEDPLLGGIYTDDGRCCPSATRIEGLLAALALLPPTDLALRQRIRASLESGVGFLLRCQVAGGLHDGGVTRTVPGYARPAEPDSRAGEIRIDYVQHALSGMLAYERVLRPAGSR